MVFMLGAQSLIVLIPCIPLQQGVGVFPVTPVPLSPKTGQGKGLSSTKPARVCRATLRALPVPVWAGSPWILALRFKT